jgi:hypothetical protein
MFEGRGRAPVRVSKVPWVGRTVGSAAHVGAGMIMIRRNASTMSAAHGSALGDVAVEGKHLEPAEAVASRKPA